MDDLRWFAPNRYCALPVPELRRTGLKIAELGDQQAGAAIAADPENAAEAFGFARRHRCPLVLYIWDLPPWRLEGGRPDWIFAAGSKLRRIPRLWGGFPERAGHYSRVGYVARRAAEVWCPSAGTMEDIRRRLGIVALRVPFCYDSERFSNAGTAPFPDPGFPFPVPQFPFTVLSISRLAPHKNHGVILRAAARLEPRPRVRILGVGPEADHLRRLAASLAVPLELPGTWATDQQILDAYRDAGVVVAPSRFEGFGVTPIEAIALGIPVIASDIPPHREFVSGAARFFPPDDHVALADALEAVISQAPGPAVLRAAAADLTIEACAARLLPQLTRILSSRS